MRLQSGAIMWTYILVGSAFLIIGLMLMMQLVGLLHVMALWVSTPFILLGLYYFVRAARPG